MASHKIRFYHALNKFLLFHNEYYQVLLIFLYYLVWVMKQEWIYWMDNFYKYPDEVFRVLTENEPPLWKWEEDENFKNNITKNTHHFEDRRWGNRLHFHEVGVIAKRLGEVFNQTSNDKGTVVTNHTRFYTDEESRKFNDYKNKWWWPHNDSGYNGIVYMNKSDDGSDYGTNLYRSKIDMDVVYKNLHEHQQPWRDKSEWTRIAAFKAKYNRFVAFDGWKYKHGMAIESDKWFYETRVNQVYFFSDKNFKHED